MLELGSDNPRALELMSMGITRMVAIEIAKLILYSFRGCVIEWLLTKKA